MYRRNYHHKLLDRYSARLHDSMIKSRFRNFCMLVDVGGVDINSHNERGQTPLIAACYLESKPLAHAMVRKLLQHGAKISETDVWGKTAIHHSVLQDRLAIFKLLMEFDKQSVSYQDSEGNTPLHLAVQQHNVAFTQTIVQHMLMYQINCSFANNAGLTPLALACKLGRVDFARYLCHTAHHSPMAIDPVTGRTARLWLETILFIPPDVDPFNCPEEDLSQIYPKPIDYIANDCKQNIILYPWFEVVGSKKFEVKKKPPSAAFSKQGKTNFPSRAQSAHRNTSKPSPIFDNYSFSSHLASQVDDKTTVSTCLDLVPYFLKLKSNSIGTLPAAMPLPDEDKATSEQEDTENDDLQETFPQSRMRDAASKGRKACQKNKSTKQKVAVVQDLVSTSSSWAKISHKKRRSVVNL